MRLVSLAIALILGLGSSSPQAKMVESVHYTKSQVFNSALRFLRVDSDYAVTEKDPDNGYLLFDYRTGSGSQTTGASVEVIQRDGEVMLIVQIPKLPSYHESLVLRGLVSKMREDYGEPPAKPRAPEPPKKDSGEQRPAEGADPDPKPKHGADGPSARAPQNP